MSAYTSQPFIAERQAPSEVHMPGPMEMLVVVGLMLGFGAIVAAITKVLRK